jgi:RNA polymerase sigma factor (sigma-70 family)
VRGSGTSIDASPKDLVSETMSPSPLRHPARLAGASLLRLQSDERLADLAAHGHEAAFDAIVDRYRTPLTRYCAGIVGPSRAEDVVQQALINAHNALQRTDEVRHLRSWLYRITHNAALNVLRAVRDDVPLDAATDAAAVAEDGPAATFERSERLRATVDAVRELPERQRAALVLRELEGRSHEEIAETLGVTSGAARQHLMRARVALRGAVTAITPYPLVVRLAEMLVSPGAAGWADVAVGAGAGATLAKLTAGVAATGALVGGAVGTERVVHHRGGAQAAAAAAAKPRAATTRAVSLPTTGTVSSPAPSTSGSGGGGSAGSETERREGLSEGESRGERNARDDDHGRDHDHDGPSDRSSGGAGRDHDGSSGPGSGGSSRNRGNDDARSDDGSRGRGGRSGPASGSEHEPVGSTSTDRESGKHRTAGRGSEGRPSTSSGKRKGEHTGSSGGDSSTSGRDHAGSADSSGSGSGRKSGSDHSVSSTTTAAPITEPSATVTTTTPSTNSGSKSGGSESGDSGSGGSGSGGSKRSGSDDAGSSDRSGPSDVSDSN